MCAIKVTENSTTFGFTILFEDGKKAEVSCEKIEDARVPLDIDKIKEKAYLFYHLAK